MSEPTTSRLRDNDPISRQFHSHGVTYHHTREGLSARAANRDIVPYRCCLVTARD